MHVGKLLTMVFINLYLSPVKFNLGLHFEDLIFLFLMYEFLFEKGSRNHGFVRKEMIDFR